MRVSLFLSESSSLRLHRYYSLCERVWVLLNKNLPTILPQSYLSIALVQPGRDYVAENEPRVLRDITKALRKNPAMILIPESTFPSILLNEDTGEPQKHAKTTQLAVRSSYQHLIDLSETYPDTSFLVGLASMQDKSSYSSLVVLEGGHITSIYHKRILFPFSERSVAWFPFKTVGALAEGENAKGVTIKRRCCFSSHIVGNSVS